MKRGLARTDIPASGGKTPAAMCLSSLMRPESFLVDARNDLVRVLRLAVAARDLALWQLRLLALDLVIRHALQDVADDVQPHPLLVVRRRDMPRRVRGVGGSE